MNHRTFPVNIHMKYLSLLGVLIAVAASSCSRTQAPPVMIPEVATVTVVRKPVTLTTELPGRTSAYLIADIRPQVNGLVQKRLFTEGSDVQAGQQLYQIDPAPFQAAYDAAKAGLARAEANVSAVRARTGRVREALSDKAVSQQDADDADASLKAAEADILYYRAAVETSRINLGYANIVSPISGRIGSSSVTDGAIVTAYQPTPLATIQQLDPIYVDVPQSTNELLRLERRMKEGRLNQAKVTGDKVELILSDGTKYPLEGVLQFRDVSVDPTTGSVIVRAVFPNPNGVLLPGMFVRASVKEGIDENAILVPQQTVSRDTKGNPVALVVNAAGIVEMRLLAVDRAIGAQWLVSSGLEAGDRVIAEGMQRVRPGVPVKVVPFEAGQQQSAAKANPASMKQ